MAEWVERPPPMLVGRRIRTFWQGQSNDLVIDDCWYLGWRLELLGHGNEQYNEEVEFMCD